MSRCPECDMPQPDDKMTLHLEECSYHDIKTCLGCKELIKKEDYEELARLKGGEHESTRYKG